MSKDNHIQLLASIPGFPRYTFTSDGKVFKDGQPKIVSRKKGRSAKVVIRANKKMHTFGLAKLIATAFNDNPHNYLRIIFKDRNHHNCSAENIEWVSNEAWGRYTRPSKAKHKNKGAVVPIVGDAMIKEIIGAPGYFITSDGRVFRKGALKRTFFKGNTKVKIKGRAYSLGKLIAFHFIPNLLGSTQIIYKDGNPTNCLLENIEWRTPSTKKPKDQVCSQKERKIPISLLKPNINNVEIVELKAQGFPGYFVTSDGRAFRGGKEIAINPKGRKAPILRLQKDRRRYYFGFAWLVASYFVPNPKRHRHTIFKDGNNENCNAANLAWVDGETFLEYCCGPIWRKGGKKLILDREDAISRCKDTDMKSYYRTLDDYWLNVCWEKVESFYRKFLWWDDIKSECYLYFVDRAKRFSILWSPTAMLWYFAKGERMKLFKEISPDMSKAIAVKYDETLRDSSRGSSLMFKPEREEW